MVDPFSISYDSIQSFTDWKLETGSTCIITCLCLCYMMIMKGKRGKQQDMLTHGCEHQDTPEITKCLVCKRSFRQSLAHMHLPVHLWHDILFFLQVRDIVSITQVNSVWSSISGDNVTFLWKKLFVRDYKDSGQEFDAPQNLSWRQFYFEHNLSRPFDIAEKYSRNGGCYLVIKGQVYDVTSFLYSHPGGHNMILDAVGTDATGVWEDFEHSHQAKLIMKELLVYDIVLSMPPKERLQGNLKVVVNRWKRQLMKNKTRSNVQRLASDISGALDIWRRRLQR